MTHFDTFIFDIFCNTKQVFLLLKGSTESYLRDCLCMVVILFNTSPHCLSFRKTSPSSFCALCLFCSSIYRRQVLCDLFFNFWKTSWLLLIALDKKTCLQKAFGFFESLIYKVWNIHTKWKSVKNILKNKIC